MLIVVTGLDGSGTTSIANKLHELDKDSYLFKTPPEEYTGREEIDNVVRNISQTAHMMYYLSSVAYTSDYIKNNCDYKNKNVYVVRYLIDTVVSHKVAGCDIKLDYNMFGNEILKPDLTIFVQLDEESRQKRITTRGKDSLDKILDDEKVRNNFLEEFNKNLDKDKTIYINNDTNLDSIVESLYKRINKE